MKIRTGTLLIILGICTADSEMLIIPMALLIAGAWMARGLMQDDPGKGDL